MANGRFALDLHVALEIIDIEGGLGGVLDSPDDDGGDLAALNGAQRAPDARSEQIDGQELTDERRPSLRVLSYNVHRWGDGAEHFRLLDRILATRPFLMGDELSLADIPTGTSSTAISSWTSSARSCGM